ncbi:MAG: hypothetical protein MO846_10820 [Candidatus Devosia symbiotica]|nr:hypothetical protein [Candidatus Devosia symbiotica]
MAEYNRSITGALKNVLTAGADERKVCQYSRATG